MQYVMLIGGHAHGHSVNVLPHQDVYVQVCHVALHDPPTALENMAYPQGMDPRIEIEHYTRRSWTADDGRLETVFGMVPHGDKHIQLLLDSHLEDVKRWNGANSEREISCNLSS